jgi:hypothetical protein
VIVDWYDRLNVDRVVADGLDKVTSGLSKALEIEVTHTQTLGLVLYGSS